jgi:hypothetical protein
MGMKKTLIFVDYANAEEDKKYIKRVLDLIEEGEDIKIDYDLIDVPPDKIDKYDYIFFDYGGIGLGASGLIDSLNRLFRKWVDDFPNKIFVIFSAMGLYYWEDDFDFSAPNLHKIDEFCIEEVIKIFKLT